MLDYNKYILWHFLKSTFVNDLNRKWVKSIKIMLLVKDSIFKCIVTGGNISVNEISNQSRIVKEPVSFLSAPTVVAILPQTVA